MNIEDSKDPWNQGQKQVSVKIPGWVAFLVKAPFRLVLGLLRASQSGSGNSYQAQDYSSWNKDNWDGTLNTDGNSMSSNLDKNNPLKK